jgi:signal transduction histidine kinase
MPTPNLFISPAAFVNQLLNNPLYGQAGLLQAACEAWFAHARALFGLEWGAVCLLQADTLSLHPFVGDLPPTFQAWLEGGLHQSGVRGFESTLFLPNPTESGSDLSATPYVRHPLHVDEQVVAVWVGVFEGQGWDVRRRATVAFLGQALETSFNYAYQIMCADKLAEEVVKERLRVLDRRQANDYLLHELGNELHLPLGYVTLLLEEDPHNPLLQTTVMKLENAKTIIQDYFEIEKNQTLKLYLPRPYRLEEVLEQVVREYTLEAQQRQQSLTLELVQAPPKPLSGDVKWIKRVFQNLVSNALKYTGEGGRIHLTLTLERDFAVVSVQDNGMGIPADSLPKLGKRFYRAPNVLAQKLRGTGLGLALVYSVVSVHQGQVEVESTEGVGTRIRVSLPLEGRIESLPLSASPWEA